MKLLFDQNVSRRLVSVLAAEFTDSTHVGAVDLDTATDREIWDYAAEHDYVIASKDSDFRQIAFLLGPPPKVLWLRVGNASTTAITDLLRTHAGDITTFGQSEAEALLVLPGLDA